MEPIGRASYQGQLSGASCQGPVVRGQLSGPVARANCQGLVGGDQLSVAVGPFQIVGKLTRVSGSMLKREEGQKTG